MVGRRRFLLIGIGGSAAALIGGTSLEAAAEPPTMLPVWRLSANWGYAVPPKNRTRCKCQACHSHAANKVFASKSVALGNRIHVCCVCQPYSIDLLASDATAIFVGSATGDSIDLRDDDARARFEAAMVRSLQPVPAPVSDPPGSAIPVAVPPPAAVPVVSAPDPDIASTALPTTAATNESSSTVTLPVTGGNHDKLLAAAVVLVAAGVAAVAASSEELVATDP